MRGRGGWRKLPSVSLVDAISISNQMTKHRNAVSVFCRVQNVASACNAGGSSSLHTMNAAARLMQPLRCTATHLKTSQCLLQHVSNTQRTQALARQAQSHLHSAHATPRHTLHYPRSPAPRRPVHHVHTGRRGDQSTARGRHAGEHDATSPIGTQRRFRGNGTEGRQRLLPTVMRKKPRLAFDELERALDLRAKLLGRLQLAADDEGK